VTFRRVRDGRWHDHHDLAAVTTFPDEWLAEREREGFELGAKVSECGSSREPERLPADLPVGRAPRRCSRA
jgi:hypothetical protein